MHIVASCQCIYCFVLLLTEAFLSTKKFYSEVSFSFSPAAKLCNGVFSPESLRCDPVKLQHIRVPVPGKILEGTEDSVLEGSFRCGAQVRLWRVLVQILTSGSGRFRKTCQAVGDST